MFHRLRIAGRPAAAAAAAAAAGALYAGSQLAGCKAAPTLLGADIPASFVNRGREQLPGDELVLEYFALQGLGELSRLILEVTGTPYTSVFHFGRGQYKKCARRLLLPTHDAAGRFWLMRAGATLRYANFGQLPILWEGENQIAQAGAIVRHLARKTFIDGGSAEEKAAVDRGHFSLRWRAP
jgi:hypothetical protein